LVNDHQIIPQTVQTENMEYPKDVVSICYARANLVISEKLTDLAVKLGNVRILNFIMLGILSNFLPFREQSWKDVLKNRVPLRFLLPDRLWLPWHH